jgi:hypothetical protein
MKCYGPHSHYKHDLKKKEQRRRLESESAAQLPSTITTVLRTTADETTSTRYIKLQARTLKIKSRIPNKR